MGLEGVWEEEGLQTLASAMSQGEESYSTNWACCEVESRGWPGSMRKRPSTSLLDSFGHSREGRPCPCPLHRAWAADFAAGRLLGGGIQGGRNPGF